MKQTLNQAFDELRTSWLELVLQMAYAMRIDRLANFLTRALKTLSQMWRDV